MNLLRRATTLAFLASAAASHTAATQAVDTSLFREMKWRMIGPHRGGRTKAAAGVPSQPNVFYIGAVNGGVWKSTDYGRIWAPIFDDQPTGSIGAIAVAPSDPDIVYVGSGEGLQRPDLSTGDGIYKSTDAGRTWTHLGLRDGQQIPQIVVDPKNPDRVLVAVLGHPYGPNTERGVFRSGDGGRSFERVLYKDENTGAVDIVLDPSNSDIVFAVLWEARQGPWENGSFTGSNSGIYKSTDGGTTWRKIGSGIPGFDQGLGRVGITVAPTMSSRMFATVELRGQGYLYRSDDAGENWYRVTEDTRVASRPSDFAEVKVDPRNPDIVYTASVVVWKSMDGGRTWKAFRGAPGGDDYHRIWINPNNSSILLIAADQGAIVTVNGGETWSSWYNQPTAQFYHVIADNAFPYRVCGAQQESGSACVQSRGDEGQLTFREWRPVGVEEYGYVAPDPLNPDVIYGGKLTRFDWRTQQTENVAPRVLRSADYRVLRTMPVLFSPVDPHTLYFASNVVWKTTSGGNSWTQISPDLTRRDSVIPPSVGTYSKMPQAQSRHPGVIYTLAPSYRDAGTIWAGSDDGLIHVTRNGGASWKNVTPAGFLPWAKVSLIDASHFDASSAYAAINTLRLDDLRPHIYRTHDGGDTWTPIVAGIPDGATINVVREDPKRRGLLYAGSEREVYVSLDDGDHWQSLRLNAPVTSIRDLFLKDNDLIAGTHGRGFWILDDISRLRQINPAKIASAPATLFQPAPVWRFRWNKNTDTPLPPDEPAAPNPPDGAIIDYSLRDASGPVVIEILERNGALVRRYASTDTAQAPADIGMVPSYWIRPTRVPSAAAGAHRFVWDLHYSYPPVPSGGYPISAVEGDTPREPRGPLVLPGEYVVRLTVAGSSYTQPITVRMDPRVKTSAAGLRQQFDMTQHIVAALNRLRSAQADVQSVRRTLRDAKGGATGPASAAPDSLEQQLASIEGDGRAGAAGASPSLGSVSGELETLYGLLQEADAAPTRQLSLAVADRIRTLDSILTRLKSLRATRFRK